MKKTIFCLLSFVLLTISSALSQNLISKKSPTHKELRATRLKNEHINRGIHLGVNFLNHQNTVVSPLIYSGIGASLAVERQNEFGNTMKTNNARVQFNMNKAENSMGNTQAVAVQLGYDYLKRAFVDKLFVGGAVQLNGNVRTAPDLGNNSVQYEVFPTIGLSSKYKIDFKLFKRNFGFETSLKLPLVGVLVATPKYAFTSDETSVNLMAVGMMTNPQTQFWLNLPAGKRFPSRQRRVGYEWNMNRFGRGNDRQITIGTHSLYFVASLEKLK